MTFLISKNPCLWFNWKKLILLLSSVILGIALALRNFLPVWRCILIEKKLLGLKQDDHQILIRGLRSWCGLSWFLKSIWWFQISWGFIVLKRFFWNGFNLFEMGSVSCEWAPSKSFLGDIASRWVIVNSGVPQGSVLSPLM